MSLLRPVGLSFCIPAILVTIFSVAGCANPLPNDAASTYPRSFPKLIRLDSPFSSDCTKLTTGWYLNKGVRVDSDGSEHEVVLTHDVINVGNLFSENDVINFSIDKKEEKSFPFSQTVLRLHIVSRSGNSWQSNWNKVFCDGGSLRITHHRHLEADLFMVLGGGDITHFAPAIDGSLVGKRLAATGGIILIIPFSHTSAETYYHFPSANHEESGNK